MREGGRGRGGGRKGGATAAFLRIWFWGPKGLFWGPKVLFWGPTGLFWGPKGVIWVGRAACRNGMAVLGVLEHSGDERAAHFRVAVRGYGTRVRFCHLNAMLCPSCCR